MFFANIFDISLIINLSFENYLITLQEILSHNIALINVLDKTLYLKHPFTSKHLYHESNYFCLCYHTYGTTAASAGRHLCNLQPRLYEPIGVSLRLPECER